MRSHVRTIVVLAIALALVVLFLSNVNLLGVLAAIARARPEWLALSLLTTFANLAIRALRWKYLLEPLGPTTFASAFRATAVGFAASAVLPARAGEVIRPYFLARQAPRDQQGRMTATGAFATIILERLLDIVTVLALLASFVFVFGKDLAGVNPTGFALVKWAGASAALVSSSALVVLFVLAGDPERLGRAMTRLEQVLPSTLAGMIARIAEKFARGLGAIRRPGRLLAALAWSLPLWLCIEENRAMPIIAMKNRYMGFIWRNPMMNIMATMPTMTMPNTQGRAFFQALTSMVRGSSGGGSKVKVVSICRGPLTRRR